MPATVIIFSGEYDLSHRDQVRIDLLQGVSEADIILDLSDVWYIDSSFINELLTLHRYRTERAFTSEIVALRHPTPKRIFDICALGNVFRVVGTLEEALLKAGKAASMRYACPGESNEGEPRPYQYEESAVS